MPGNAVSQAQEAAYLSNIHPMPKAFTLDYQDGELQERKDPGNAGCAEAPQKAHMDMMCTSSRRRRAGSTAVLRSL